jgi:hypothetical protein
MKRIASLLIGLVLFPALTASAAVLEGTVQKVDRAKQQIVLNTESGTEIVAISHATKGAEKLKPADKIRVTYRKKGAKLIAESIAPNKGGPPPLPAEIPPA